MKITRTTLELSFWDEMILMALAVWVVFVHVYDPSLSLFVVWSALHMDIYKCKGLKIERNQT